MHRDKPQLNMNTLTELYMFPVCTGINRWRANYLENGKHVPCMHRDKPISESVYLVVTACSLYAQG